MGKSHKNGKSHVISVYNDLKEKNSSHPTAIYIKNLFPNFTHVESKYEHPQPDTQPDITIIVDGKRIKINLFSIRGNGAIQPKNLGAKSFIEKYFGNEYYQRHFNEMLDSELKLFYKEILYGEKVSGIYETLPLLRKEVKERFPSFNNDINSARTGFLIRIRDHAFNILKEFYNTDKEVLKKTFSDLMLVDSINIVSRNKNREIYSVEQWNFEVDFNQPIEIYKKGVSTIGIRVGKQALTLRLKFESAPHTSIKLASSYEIINAESEIKIVNEDSIKEFDRAIEYHEFTQSKVDSNAIGKCNEAIIYYELVKQNKDIEQVNSKTFIELYMQYSHLVSKEIINDLLETAKSAIYSLKEYLTNRYGEYTLKSIELVPESYIKDRLDTTDLKLGLVVAENYLEEDLSLKAIAKTPANVTVKNPGAGQILGMQYFGIGTLRMVIDHTKIEFEKGNLDHMESMIKISKELGESLLNASQESLQKGLRALIGEQTKVISVYKLQSSKIIQYKEVGEIIKVMPQFPTKINTQIIDVENNLELTLRVKFSKRQDYGWSSIKLAAEMKIM